MRSVRDAMRGVAWRGAVASGRADPPASVLVDLVFPSDGRGCSRCLSIPVFPSDETILRQEMVYTRRHVLY